MKGSDWSGYEVTSFDDVDPQLGTMDDFEGMVKAMHRKDMYFVMDFMPALVSAEHPWAKDPTKESWFVSKTTPGDKTRAILNLKNPAVLGAVMV